MNLVSVHWFELTLLIPLVGALSIACFTSSIAAARWSLGVTISTLACASCASVQFAATSTIVRGWPTFFEIDDLSAPMLPMLAWLHLITLMGTAKSRVSPQFCVRLLLAEFTSLAVITCQSRSAMIGLLIFGTVFPAWDLFGRCKPLRGFFLYMSVYVFALVGGWWFSSVQMSSIAVGWLLIALLLRGGIFPIHGWQPPLIQHASLGTATLFVLPLVEVLAAIRLVVPVAPLWMLQLGAAGCLATAVYCGSLAVVQNNVRRFYAHLCLSQTSLVLFAVMVATPSSLTAALCLWISALVSLSGLGFAIRALEARFGELSLNKHHGYYAQVPGLAVCFFSTGLAAVGFPGTVGFIPMELLISSSMEQGFFISLTLALVAMLNGLSIMRAYFALFTGRRPMTSVLLQETAMERAAIVILTLLVFVGGWCSPAIVESRHRVAEELLMPHDVGPTGGGRLRPSILEQSQLSEHTSNIAEIPRWP